jgi:ankyrin repeat protein
MTRQLSHKSTMAVLKQDAKRWLALLRTANADAIRRLKSAWPSAPAEPTLRDVQHAVAREYGFADWKTLTAAVSDLALDQQSHAERVDAVLRHGWGGDLMQARRIVERYPEVRSDSIFTAAVCGDVAEVTRRLAHNSSLATAVGGGLNWTALAYVAYGRLDATHALDIAQLLLDAGANPNFAFDDGWGNAFTLITGAIGLGEGVKPTHPQARELVELFIAAGADPYDMQALYNTSIVNDDTTWNDVLWSHCERLGTTALWSQTEGRALGGRFKVGTLNYLLGNAVPQNHIKRVQWLLAHGANAETVNAYSGQPVHTVARLAGYSQLAALLARHGATEHVLRGDQAFLAALMQGNDSDVRTRVAADPSLVRNASMLLKVAEHGNAHAAALLLELGANVNAVDHDGISALHQAVHAGSVATIDVLLANGAEVDVRERKWRATPLGWACHLGKWLAAERLAPVSRDVRALAASARTARLAEVLHENPTLANHKLDGHDMPTPLFCLPDDDEAAAEVARILLAHGADTTVRNAQGRVAEQVARFRGLDEAAELMA